MFCLPFSITVAIIHEFRLQHSYDIAENACEIERLELRLLSVLWRDGFPKLQFFLRIFRCAALDIQHPC